MRYRVHIVPALRSIGGRVLLRDWLAITIGHHIFAWRVMSPVELAHEVEHVRQWDAHGILYVPRYLRSSWRAWRAGRDRYRDNGFEIAARAAADREAARVGGTVPPRDALS